MRIRHAVDSHGHNDYLSGLTEVAARAEVELLASAVADIGYGHRALRDGEQFELGEVGFEVLHTPEHISLLVYDRSASVDVPAMLLSGGALLVGDLARPDLLGGRDQAEAAAKEFCHTIQTKILELPDHIEVFPTHVAGSLCGGNIGSRLSTIVGYERRTNDILATVSSKGEFVEQCLRLDNLPAVPPYWKRMRQQNLAGVAPLGVLAEPPALKPDAVRRAIGDGAVVLDTRPPEAFGGAHIPGALNVGQGAAFPTWAGTVPDEDAAVVLVLDSPADLWPVTWDLLRIGYDVPVGWLGGGMMAWRTEALDLARLPQITVHELRHRLDIGDVDLLDVRQPGEWAAGHVDGATFITGGELPHRLDDVPCTGKPVAVACGSGYRSSVSASLLDARTDLQDPERTRRHDGMERGRLRHDHRRYRIMTGQPHPHYAITAARRWIRAGSTNIIEEGRRCDEVIQWTVAAERPSAVSGTARVRARRARLPAPISPQGLERGTNPGNDPEPRTSSGASRAHLNVPIDRHGVVADHPNRGARYGH